METSPGIPTDLQARLAECEQRIGYRFRDRGLLLSALTHASGANHRLASNERLEFLGDAILGAVVCDLLYHQFPESLEGDLTKIKSMVVSRLTCEDLLRFEPRRVSDRWKGNVDGQPGTALGRGRYV